MLTLTQLFLISLALTSLHAKNLRKRQVIYRGPTSPCAANSYPCAFQNNCFGQSSSPCPYQAVGVPQSLPFQQAISLPIQHQVQQVPHYVSVPQQPLVRHVAVPYPVHIPQRVAVPVPVPQQVPQIIQVVRHVHVPVPIPVQSSVPVSAPTPAPAPVPVPVPIPAPVPVPASAPVTQLPVHTRGTNPVESTVSILNPLNNTNIVNVTTHINSTNINNISVPSSIQRSDSKSESPEQCCSVLTPPRCDERRRWNCRRTRFERCGSVCNNARVIYLRAKPQPIYIPRPVPFHVPVPVPVRQPMNIPRSSCNQQAQSPYLDCSGSCSDCTSSGGSCSSSCYSEEESDGHEYEDYDSYCSEHGGPMCS